MVQFTIEQQLHQLNQQYEIVATVDLDQWPTDYDQAKRWLNDILTSIHKVSYSNNERIVFTITRDYFVNNDNSGLILKNLQIALNEIDISNFFVIVLSTNAHLNTELQSLAEISQDQVPISGIVCAGDFSKIPLPKHPHSYKETYQYGSAKPIKIKLSDLSEREDFLLTESKTFCMYPWIHLHAFPTGDAHPCCYSEMKHAIGSTKKHTLKEIWNDQPMRDLRQRMLNEQPSGACRKCYEQEDSGFFSGRQSANKHFGHHINRVSNTQPDGKLDQFEMTYWDIRFSNLCNLSCRSCGHIFSSSWHKDQAQLVGNDWIKKNPVLNYAGRTETDIWEQLIPHLDYVEQIYFAGGEPLMMAEHYNILDELERRNRWDVRLIYNTNFTHTRLKNRTVFDYWKRFQSVSIGASLDAMGSRAEYIRKGTDWDRVTRNREEMLQVCPNVDFYISPTLSILNAHHLPDFHRSWTEQGLIRPQDLNVNILQDPSYLRIDIAPAKYKEILKEKYQEHLQWLRPLDQLQRATVGFESAINFMSAIDNSDLLPNFWSKTNELDQIRNENLLDIIPELSALK
jgi:MoaA/NifB/PqqE/SkfB family radical SAM enzyme